MKFTVTFEVPDGTMYAIEGVNVTGFVPPFEDELIPLPPEAIPVQEIPRHFAHRRLVKPRHGGSRRPTKLF